MIMDMTIDEYIEYMGKEHPAYFPKMDVMEKFTAYPDIEYLNFRGRRIGNIIECIRVKRPEEVK